MHWDTAKVRRQRECGWFSQHEAELIEAARGKREENQHRSQGEEAERLRGLHWKKCPECGNDLRDETIEGVQIAKCLVCDGIFFKRGELEALRLRHDEQRRGFFRRLLGLHAD